MSYGFKPKPTTMLNKKLFSLALATMPIVASAQFARVEVIHNCADAAASTVDVYVNGSIFREDFAFRTTTGWINVPADIPLTIGIAPGSSSSAADVFANFPVTFSSANKYVVVASGIESPSGYNPSPAFNLEVYDMGRESALVATNTDVLVFHGSTDAPTVDVVETGAGAGTVIDDLSYAEFSGYLPLPTANYVIEVRDATGTTSVKSYDVPLQSLGLTGAAITVVASGFLNPSTNSDGEAFGLYASTGVEGALLPLPESSARVEIIHNCADALAAEVDVYLNGGLAIDNFAFRTTTGFIDLPAGVELNIGIAPGNSTSAADVIAPFNVTLASGGTYVVVANGIVSPTGYSPSPAFDLHVFAAAREAASSMMNTDVLVFHGSTDAPTVDVVEIGAGAGTVINDLAYADFQGYLELPTSDYILDIRDETGTESVFSYSAPLATLGLSGAAVTVVASGFLDPNQNSDGEGFGLWASLGTEGALIPLPLYTVGVQDRDVNMSLNAYPNPANEQISIEFSSATNEPITVSLIDVAGRSAATSAVNGLTGGRMRTSLDLNGVQSGIYTLRLQSNSGVATRVVSVVR